MKVTLNLTIAQIDFFRNDIETGEALGDCKLTGLTLVMDDYEGANTTLQRFMRRPTKTTRQYVSWNSTVDRLNAAIVKAAGAR